MTATQIVEKSIEAIKSGKTLYVSNHLKCWKINKRTLDSFEKAGNPVLKASDKTVYMKQGKSYVCITYCRFTLA